MIRILFFIETLRSGGAEKVLLNLANSMDLSKFDVTVATPWPEDCDLLDDRIAYRSLYPSGSAFYRKLYRLEAALGTAVRRLGSGYDIEVAYLECGPTKIMAASKSSAKKIAWVHCDLKRKSDDPAAFVRQTAPWYRKYDRVVCVSGDVRDSFLELYGDAVPVSVLYNVNNEAEILEKADAFPVPAAAAPTLCALGRLSQQKNFGYLIRSCARLKEEGIPFRLQIIGEGPERQALEALIRETRTQDCIHLLGWQENPYPFMKAADVIVCSSVYEGLSTVTIEALILGKAVVTTPCTGMAELLGNSEHGLIAESDENGLYRSLRRMLMEPGLRQHFEIAAKKRGLDFRRDVLTQKTEHYFTELLEGTRSE